MCVCVCGGKIYGHQIQQPSLFQIFTQPTHTCTLITHTCMLTHTHLYSTHARSSHTHACLHVHTYSTHMHTCTNTPIVHTCTHLPQVQIHIFTPISYVYISFSCRVYNMVFTHACLLNMHIFLLSLRIITS